jgi:hypothetical protein
LDGDVVLGALLSLGGEIFAEGFQGGNMQGEDGRVIIPRQAPGMSFSACCSISS